MQPMYFSMHFILHIAQQMHIYLTKITLSSKKSRKTLKKFIFFICVLNFIHIFAAVEKTKIFIRRDFLNKMQPKTTE